MTGPEAPTFTDPRRRASGVWSGGAFEYLRCVGDRLAGTAADRGFKSWLSSPESDARSSDMVSPDDDDSAGEMRRCDDVGRWRETFDCECWLGRVGEGEGVRRPSAPEGPLAEERRGVVG